MTIITVTIDTEKQRVVPVEPTAAMIDLARSQSSFPAGIYRAMLSAAPACPQAEVSADGRQNDLDVFNRAARDLPNGYEIAISIEPGSASVSLLKAGGGSEDCYFDGSTVEQQIESGIRIAIDTAIRAGGGE